MLGGEADRSTGEMVALLCSREVILRYEQVLNDIPTTDPPYATPMFLLGSGPRSGVA